MRYVLFTANWCPSCPTMKGMVERAKAETGATVDVVDVEEAPEELQPIAITIISLPLLVALDGDQPISRIQGLVPYDTVRAFLKAPA